jgi:hypothetical protein
VRQGDEVAHPMLQRIAAANLAARDADSAARSKHEPENAHSTRRSVV